MMKQMMESLVIETERLTLRRCTLEDSAFIVELLNTEGWLRYIGDRNVKTLSDAEEYIRAGPLHSYQVHGFGLCLVVEKASGHPIGICGLLKRDYLEHPDIGFALLPQYAGKGYASEIAHATVQWGFQTFHFEQICAIVLPDNRASLAVLERLGFRHERTVTQPDTGEELLLWSVLPPNADVV
jgi:RimJ/RimL family protein N-acetyltransferase